jgi:calcium/calmodulin-dependent protein kinase I
MMQIITVCNSLAFRIDGEELFERIVRAKGYQEKDAVRVVYQLLLAVNYMHAKNIVHRDLKVR